MRRVDPRVRPTLRAKLQRCEQASVRLGIASVQTGSPAHRLSSHAYPFRKPLSWQVSALVTRFRCDSICLEHVPVTQSILEDARGSPAMRQRSPRLKACDAGYHERSSDTPWTVVEFLGQTVDSAPVRIKAGSGE
jgi:hypothetical protein